eukprot:1778413-Rhodomonas_salina.2
MLPQLPREAEKVLEQEAKEREKREDKEAEKAKGLERASLAIIPRVLAQCRWAMSGTDVGCDATRRSWT